MIEEVCGPVDWRCDGERELALDTAEAAFAERCYIERHPPIPSEFVGCYTRAIKSLGEPAWPDWARWDLLLRCIYAQRYISARDETYKYFRWIYTEGEREAAVERRRRAKESARRWHEDGDRVALEDMLEALDEMHAERSMKEAA